MPSTNRLGFLRPLYDIAVWQFILMLGFYCKEQSRRRSVHLKFTWKMHEVVANFVCKLLEARAFDHLKVKMEEEEAKSASDGWTPGQRATKKLTEWCQDQWRRKKPIFPTTCDAFAENVPCTMPWFVDSQMPVCFNCGVPCPECRNELGLAVPVEMSTARAILDFAQIHPENEGADESNNGQQESMEGSTEGSTRMTLRSSRKKN